MADQLRPWYGYADGGDVVNPLSETEKRDLVLGALRDHFNPEGDNYDYIRAISSNMGPTGTGENLGHWGSVAPVDPYETLQYGLPENSYVVLKGHSHHTFPLAEQGEKERGSKIIKLGDRYFSVPHDYEVPNYADGGAVSEDELGNLYDASGKIISNRLRPLPSQQQPAQYTRGLIREEDLAPSQSIPQNILRLFSPVRMVNALLPVGHDEQGKVTPAFPSIVADPAESWVNMVERHRAGIDDPEADVRDSFTAASSAGFGGLAGVGMKPTGAVGTMGGRLMPKELPMDLPSRMARAKEMGFDTDKVWYHGTTHDFNEFDPTKANTESHFGGGSYFTTSPEDAALNYGPNGPDLTNRIEGLAERISSNEDIDMDAARIQAKEQIAGSSDGAIYPVHLRGRVANVSEKSGKPTWLEYSEQYKPEDFLKDAKKELGPNATEDEIFDRANDIAWEENAKKEPVGELADFLNSIKRQSGEYGFDYDKVLPNLYDYLADGSIKASELNKRLRDTDLMYAEHPETGNFIGYDVIRQAFHDAGYPNIIMDAKEAFPKMNMPEDTLHMIVSDPRNIRSVNAAFDPAKKDSANLLAANAKSSAAIPLALSGLERGTDLPRLPIQRALDQGLYSALDETINNTQRKRGIPAAWIKEAKRYGATDKEIKWRGLDEFLRSKPGNKDVSKEEIQSFLNDRPLKALSQEHTSEGMQIDDMRNVLLEDNELRDEFSDKYRVELDQDLVNKLSSEYSVKEDPKNGWEILDSKGEGVDFGWDTEADARERIFELAEKRAKENYGWAVYDDNNNKIQDGFNSSDSAQDAAYDSAYRDFEEYISKAPLSSLQNDYGLKRGETTSDYLRDLPSGGKDYLERVTEIDPEGLKKLAPDIEKWAFAGDPHPDTGYNRPVGWTLESTYQDALDRGEGQVIHEIQSPHGQRLAKQGEPASQAQIDAWSKERDQITKFLNQYVKTKDNKVYDLSSIDNTRERRMVSSILKEIDDQKSKIKINQQIINNIKRDPSFAGGYKAEDKISQHEHLIDKNQATIDNYTKELAEIGADIKIIEDPAQAEQVYSTWQKQNKSMDLKKKDIEKRIELNLDAISPAPLVDTNSGLPPLFKKALYNAAISNKNWLAISGPQRIKERWGKDTTAQMYDKKTRNILLKLAKQHDPKAEIESFYPSEVAGLLKTFDQDEINQLSDELKSFAPVEKVRPISPDENIVNQWKEENGEPFYGIRLTPEMRQSILKKGFSTFRDGGTVHNTDELPRLRPLN